MEEIDKKSIIELASSHTDPVDFIIAINDKYSHVPLNEKGSLLENVGIIVYQSLFFNHALSAWFYALKYYNSINSKSGEGRCYGNISNTYKNLYQLANVL